MLARLGQVKLRGNDPVRFQLSRTRHNAFVTVTLGTEQRVAHRCPAPPRPRAVQAVERRERGSRSRTPQQP